MSETQTINLVRVLVIEHLYRAEQGLVALDCALIDGTAGKRLEVERGDQQQQINGLVELLMDLQRAPARRVPLAALLQDLTAQREAAELDAPSENELAAAREVVARENRRRSLRARSSLLGLLIESVREMAAVEG